jgi:hypothetical protein
VGKNYATKIAARGISMAIYEKISIKEANNRGYASRHKQRSFNATQKNFLLTKQYLTCRE